MRLGMTSLLFGFFISSSDDLNYFHGPGAVFFSCHKSHQIGAPTPALSAHITPEMHFLVRFCGRDIYIVM
jgi:hypothetical protein